MAGRQLFEKLRRIHPTNKRRHSFEEIWPALKAHHDTPTPGELWPHPILFGWDPVGHGLPFSGEGMAMDAKEFFDRQETTSGRFVSSSRRSMPCELRPSESLQRRNSAWVTRCRYSDPGLWALTAPKPGSHPERLSAESVETPTASRWAPSRSGNDMKVHPREPDVRGKDVSLDYATHEADSDDNYAEHDDYTVEKLLAQRPSALAPGGVEFMVRWGGYGPSHDT